MVVVVVIVGRRSGCYYLPSPVLRLNGGVRREEDEKSQQ